MTEQELKAIRELVYLAREIAFCMAGSQNLPAWQIAGSLHDPESELVRLMLAIDRVGPMVYPAWNHRHADELTK